MEVQNSENILVATVPVGFRFRPSDEELVLYYLKRKVFSLSLPVLNPIPDLDVFNSNPWDLPGDLNEKRYFFSKTEKDGLNKCGKKLSSGCGYWKACGKNKQVVARGTNIVIAIRRSFVFYKGKSNKTQWIMKQFRLVGSFYNLTQRVTMHMGDWVVCRVYQSKKKLKNGAKPANSMKSVICDQNELGLPSVQDSPVSQCLSGISDATSYSDVDQEEANSRNVM